MPSPFPGMDPYLEGDLWTSFHTQFAVEIARQLSPKLRPRYAALTEKRYITDTPEDVAITQETFSPDVGVLELQAQLARGPTTALAPAPMETVSLIPESVPHVWIEIRDTELRRLVTAIEFLSPTNKHGQGREDYLSKRYTILKSEVHLLEVDLVRKGRRVPLQDPLPPNPYFVFLSRGQKRFKTEYWPIAWTEPLPTVPVPLLEGDGDVELDLQQAFNSVYDSFNFEFLIDYGKAPPPPKLSKSAMIWLETVLTKAGKRS